MSQPPDDRNRPSGERPYKLYRSTPRSIGARLRGESDAELEARADQLSRQQPPRAPRGEPRRRARRDRRYDQVEPGGRGGGAGNGGRGGGNGGRGSIFGARRNYGGPRRGLRRLPGLGPAKYPLLHPLRILKWIVTIVIFWLVLSVVLFFISASTKSGNLPGGAATKAALSSAGPMLFSANNVLVVGLDSRPTSGYSSKEGGANYNELDANTDTLMIWHVGGGVSRKLSIPRDTLVDMPGCGWQKINAAWSCGGPKETIQVVESLTGLKINHMIVVDLGNFVKFIDDIGGVTVTTPRICSNISGGAADGGYTLNLAPGKHHLSGVQAVTLARTRDNSCNIAYTDINRERMQQQIMNGIKSQLFSAHAFIHLPWASWDAPGAVQTDMGGLTLLQLFASAEIGGNSPTLTLNEPGSTYNGEDVLLQNKPDLEAKVNKLINGS